MGTFAVFTLVLFVFRILQSRMGVKESFDADSFIVEGDAANVIRWCHPEAPFPWRLSRWVE